MERSTELDTEEEIVAAAVTLLKDLLPATWTITANLAEAFAMPVGATPIPNRPGRFDGVIQIQAPSNGYAELVVEARKTFAPRDVAAMLRSINPVYRRQRPGGIVVIAPRLSQRARDLLAAAGIHYIDLVGRIHIRVDMPPLFIEREIPDDKPLAESTAATQLRGPRAGRIVRVLLDATPPYRVKDLAKTAGVSVGYVSKALDALDAEALIERGGRGEVLACDWQALLRRWASSYSMLSGRRTAPFIAQRGIAEVVNKLRGIEERWVISGSFGATSLAPVTAPSLLIIYTDSIGEVQERTSMLPTEQAADVLLVEPADPVVYERHWLNGQYLIAAPTQLAADCLNGPGRMPAEGEALIGWMADNERLWRSPDLASLSDTAKVRTLPARPLFSERG
jgi:hypothetical protein